MIRLLLVLMTIAMPAFGDLRKVSAGDHDGFTRLVVEFNQRVDWQFGRTADGYELRTSGKANPYDLSKVFDIIGKTRLAAVWADPRTGNLRIGIACACFAIPFEFRPGIVVIDLKQGKPPAGSSFEFELPALSVDPEKAAPPVKPVPRPEPVDPAMSYNWLRPQPLPVDDLHQPKPLDEKAKSEVTDLSLPPLSLEILQDSVLFALATGAAKGVVELEMPRDSAPRVPQGPLKSARVAFGSMPGSLQRYADPVIDEQRPLETCQPPETLSIYEWGNDTAFAEQLAIAGSGLTGEFDKPDPVTVEKYVRLQIFGGFGAEARAVLQAFPDLVEGADVLESLSYLVDAEPENATYFDGMITCAGPAALWALLQTPHLPVGTPIDQEAALTAFSALPKHLRRLLGEALVERFTVLKLPAPAQAVRDATERGRKPMEGKTDLAAAEWALANGKPADATKMLEEIMKNPGPEAARALIAWVDAQTAQLLPVDETTVLALEAFGAELAGQPQEQDLKRAKVFAQAGSGRFTLALAGANEGADQSRVWALLAQNGTDSAILEDTLGMWIEASPMMTDQTAQKLAERLLGLGFPQAARDYLSQTDKPDPLLGARIELANLDSQAALMALGTLKSIDAMTLRAQATELMGRTEEARRLYEENDLADQSARLSKTARDWDRVAKDTTGPWGPVALSVVKAEGDVAAGTLSRAARRVELSAQLRNEVQALLDATKVN